jgi:YVTN family beta-propeller protein
VNPEDGRVYVIHYNNSELTMINGTAGTTSGVGVGTSPIALAVNPVTDKVYVANSGSGNATVIDGSSYGTSVIGAGLNPYAIAVNPVTHTVYATNNGSSNVTVIDGSTHATTAVPAGSNPFTIVVNPVANKVYVANETGASVTVIDGATLATATVAVGSFPDAIAVNPVTNRIYVANLASSSVTVIDGATLATSTVPGVPLPVALAVNPVTNKVYVADQGSETVTVIDGATGSISTVSVGAYPVSQLSAVAVNPATNRVYVADSVNNVVTVIDGATLATSVVPTGYNPCFIEPDVASNKIYVVNNGGSGVTVIDGATGATLSLVTGANPLVARLDPATDRIYVANGMSGTVTMIDGATGATATIAVGSLPHDLAVDPETGEIFVADYNSASVTVITEERHEQLLLVASVTPLGGNQAASTTPGFTFGAQSSFSPTAPGPLGVLYQVDTCGGAWTRATGGGGTFSGTVPALQQGVHILYFYADDGQDATSTQSGSPLTGAIGAYAFLVPQLVFTLAPASQQIASGRSVAFSAFANGSPAPAYQWSFDGVPISGATDATLLVSGATSGNAGTYSCTATNSTGSISVSAVLTVIGTTAPGYLANLSARANVGSGSNLLIAGFGVGGAGTAEFLLRGVGPGLASMNVSGTLSNPILTLYDGSAAPGPYPIATDIGWGNAFTAGSSPVNALPQAATGTLMASVGAFTLAPGSADCALAIAPPAGSYTVQVSGAGNSSGIALAEVYAAGSGPPGLRLINVSARADVGAGNNVLIGGLTIGGTTAETVLIRAVGPGLVDTFHLTGTLAQPTLTVYSGSVPVFSNTGWGGDATVAGAAIAVGAFPLNPSHQDSALLVTLPPGSYTVQVGGVNGGAGIALVEVYELP